jgi:hypothetical protein
MAEAKISQLAKLLSAVMEYDDLPVEIHNAIADWSCPGERVSNSPALFELMLEDSKAHPEGCEDPPNVSHEGRPKLVFAEKEAPQSKPVDRTQAEDLAVNVAGVLNNEACPDHLRSAITDALCELQTRSDCLGNVDFLMGLFLSKPRQVEGGAA